MDLLLSCLSLSLFDSFSTAQQIIVFVLLLNTARPRRNAGFFLIGLSGTYALAGLVGCRAFASLQAWFHLMPFSSDSVSDSSYHLTEVLGGLAMIGFGLHHFLRQRHPQAQSPEARLLERITARFGHIGGRASFWIGAILSLTTLPVSIPYFVALGKIAGAHLGAFGDLRHVLLYNLGYASPMLAILAIHLWLSRRNADIPPARMRENARLLNLHLTTWTLAGVGILSLTDGAWYFLSGHALIKGRLL